MTKEFEEDLPSSGAYSLTSYDSTSEESLKEDQKPQEDLNKEARLDKRSQNIPHTVIVTKQNQRFELVGTLTEEEVKELQSQTTLIAVPQNKKKVLGEGNSGRARLAKNEEGRYVTVKKIKKPPPNIERELEVCDELREYQIPNVMLPEASIQTVNKKDNVTIYQFMPLADFGDGDLLKFALMAADLNQHERELLVSHMSNLLITSFDKMHANGIYHLDFKPANLLIDGQGNLYIADFGSSLMHKHIDEGLLKTDVDVSYVPPEYFAAGQKSAKDLRNIDNWRLGMTLLQLSYPEINLTSIRRPVSEAYSKLKETGVRPDYDLLASEVEKGVESVRHQLEIRNVPSHMQDIIMGLLTVDPEQRMTSHRAMEEMKKVAPISTDAFNDTFVKLLPEKPFAEFMQKVRKCNSVEQEVNRVSPNVSESLKEQQMHLMKYKDYINVLQDEKLGEKEKVRKLHDAYTQFNSQQPKLSEPVVPPIKQKPILGG